MNIRKSKIGIVSILAVVALAGCARDNRTRVDFWTGFGGGVNAVLQPLLDRFEKENPDIRVVYETKGGYDNLRQSIVQSVSNSAYPHIANGYPDHFADYANSNILLNLDTARYMNNEDPNIGVNVDDYLANYMTENTTLIDGRTTGLPFNKSTEIMVANQTLFDVAALALEDDTVKVPTTWQELATVGLKLKNLVTSKGWAGKFILDDGTAVSPEKEEENKENIVLDFTNYEKASDFIPFSWDSTSNFFITIIRQWDGVYTERGETFHNGKIKFHEGENRTKTLAALTFFKDLYTQGLVGIPDSFGEGLYSSNPFKKGMVALTVSSSAGVKENIPTGVTDYPFAVTVNAIPFNADFPDNRYVISQGTNLALFNRGRGDNEKHMAQREAAWKLLRYLTYEVNHEFGIGTSYFPVTDGSKLPVDESNQRYKDYKLYLDFLQKETGKVGEIATRDTARLQADVYQEITTVDGAEVAVWKQFVDPGFIGSSRVRNEIESVIGALFAGHSPERVVDDVIKQLGDFVSK